MIKIEQDILCNFCRRHNDKSESWHCEGALCDEAEEIYLEDHGITDDSEKQVTFGLLNVGNTFYKVEDSTVIPSIVECKINRIQQMEDSKFYIWYGQKSIEIYDKNTNSQGMFFINKKDAKRALEEICVERIISLSKVIGTLASK